MLVSMIFHHLSTGYLAIERDYTFRTKIVVKKTFSSAELDVWNPMILTALEYFFIPPQNGSLIVLCTPYEF